MRISFKNKKLCKQLTQSKELHKLGPRRAGLVQRRLFEIEASDNLAITAVKIIEITDTHE